MKHLIKHLTILSCLILINIPEAFAKETTEPVTDIFADVSFQTEEYCERFLNGYSQNRFPPKKSKFKKALASIASLHFSSNWKKYIESEFFALYLYIKTQDQEEFAQLSESLAIRLLLDTEPEDFNFFFEMDDHINQELATNTAFRQNVMALGKKLLPEKASWQMKLKQFVTLPARILAIKRKVAKEYSFRVLDENLYGFWGFHHPENTKEHFPEGAEHLNEKHYRRRTWIPVHYKVPGPHELDGKLSAADYARIASVAAETEAPIKEYSWKSGETFRILLKNLGRFMGKNAEEAKAVEEGRSNKYCESPWCAEEERHDPGLRKLIAQISGIKFEIDNPNSADTSTDEPALDHLVTRMVAEWGSSASYLVMAMHTKGASKMAMENIMRDEIKHLALVSAAFTYLKGPDLNLRLKLNFKELRSLFSHHGEERSVGTSFSDAWISISEIVITLYYVEKQMRRWLKTLPKPALEHIFETESELPDIEAVDVAPAEVIRVEKLVEESKVKRKLLYEWREKDKTKEREQEFFEKTFARYINQFVIRELYRFEGFNQAKTNSFKVIKKIVEESDLAKEYFKASNAKSFTEFKRRLALACYRKLRQRQIFNNWYMQGLYDPAVDPDEIQALHERTQSILKTHDEVAIKKAELEEYRETITESR